MPIKSGRFKKKKLLQFQSVKKHIQSIENLEKSYFWKTEHFNAKTPQSTMSYKKMHEYEMKSFSKTLEFNPNLPKTRFSINIVLKAQTLSTFCIKIKEHIILDGHNKITHNIMYQV